jgi:2-alkyl-3-oxoalkanoate reductase
MMNKLRVAVIGAGFISSNRHLPAWRSLGSKVELVGLSDLNRDMATTVARQFKVRQAYADPADMIAKEKPDVVDICTPPATHARLALLAMEQGCHMLIEKPMALSNSDCDAIVNGAKRYNVKVCVGHTGLFYEPFIRGRRMVEEGAIGRFQGMRVVISTPTDYMTSNRDHWAHKLPGGAIGETGPHAVYMSLAFMDRVQRVTVDGLKQLPQYSWSQYEDYRINLVGDGAISSIHVNYASNQWMSWVEIAGSTGTLILDLHGRVVTKINRPALTVPKFAVSVVGQAAQILKEAALTTLKVVTRREASTHEHLIRGFADSLLNGTKVPVPAEEGREAVRVMGLIADQLAGRELEGTRAAG